MTFLPALVLSQVHGERKERASVVANPSSADADAISTNKLTTHLPTSRSECDVDYVHIM
jgi:hypothetical protein